MSDKYEDSTNRETWLIKLWIDNDRGTHFYWRDRTAQIVNSDPQDQARHRVAEALQEWVEDLQPKLPTSAFSDLLATAIGRVDWHEIADALIDDAAERATSGRTVVLACTRRQAIEGGSLVDVSDVAQEAGFRLPVAMTAAAWTAAVEVPFNTPCQDETGRLWDVLNVLRFSVIGRIESQIGFSVAVVGAHGVSCRVDLKSICAPGDDAEPALTIMLPHED